jgi:hypothetical protein
MHVGRHEWTTRVEAGESYKVCSSCGKFAVGPERLGLPGRQILSPWVASGLCSRVPARARDRSVSEPADSLGSVTPARRACALPALRLAQKRVFAFRLAFASSYPGEPCSRGPLSAAVRPSGESRAPLFTESRATTAEPLSPFSLRSAPNARITRKRRLKK